MLPDDFVHTVNNQLEIVLGKAELLELTAPDQPTKESCAQIKAAASRVAILMNAFFSSSPENGAATDIKAFQQEAGRRKHT